MNPKKMEAKKILLGYLSPFRVLPWIKTKRTRKKNVGFHLVKRKTEGERRPPRADRRAMTRNCHLLDLVKSRLAQDILR
jgi:hypothetical protein